MTRSRHLDAWSFLFLIFVLAFFALFLVYPLGYVFVQAFFPDDRFSLGLFGAFVESPHLRGTVLNSLLLAVVSTLATLAVAMPLALFFSRFRFPGKGILQTLLLVPLILPPFVGAVGMKEFFGLYGAVNQGLTSVGLPRVDWYLDAGLYAIVILQVLHLYPILYLNLVAALSNVDPSLEEAAKNYGSSGFRVFRTVTLPLVMPGLFAGSALVFIWAFTDLGTPLVWGFEDLVAVRIFRQATTTSTDPMGYVLVLLTFVLTAVLFYLSKRTFGAKSYAMTGHGLAGRKERPTGVRMRLLIYGFVAVLLFLATLPHLSVVLTSVSADWYMTALPTEYTVDYYRQVLSDNLTSSSIRLSFFLSIGSTLLDIALGVGIAWLLARKVFPGRDWLDALTMIPLVAPGVVLAFGYVTCFAGVPGLDPRWNPIPLLIIGYAVRRIPFMVRAGVAGFQNISVTLEEASANLGESSRGTFRRVVLPMLAPSLMAGGLLVFAFSMLEVSDSLILSLSQQYYPLTKAIYVLINRTTGGPELASALGVLGMILLLATFAGAQKLMGRKMGDVFRM